MSVMYRLRDLPFLSMTEKEQIRVVKMGKPMPIIELRVNKTDDFINIGLFNSKMYYCYSWITGCSSSCSFSCWPCILYCNTFHDIKLHTVSEFSEFVSSHQFEHDHRVAVNKLKVFKDHVERKGDSMETKPDRILKRVLKANENCTIVQDFKSSLINLMKSDPTEISKFTLIDIFEASLRNSNYNIGINSNIDVVTITDHPSEMDFVSERKASTHLLAVLKRYRKDREIAKGYLTISLKYCKTGYKKELILISLNTPHMTESDFDNFQVIVVEAFKIMPIYFPDQKLYVQNG